VSGIGLINTVPSSGLEAFRTIGDHFREGNWEGILEIVEPWVNNFPP
jgi:hypothetical protein